MTYNGFDTLIGIGRRVVVEGKVGTITSIAGAYLDVRADDGKYIALSAPFTVCGPVVAVVK